MNERYAALDDVFEAAEEYREAQVAALDARERFIDAIIAARRAKATHIEIAERCIIEPGSQEHLSRQRVGQFIQERALKHSNVAPFTAPQI